MIKDTEELFFLITGNNKDLLTNFKSQIDEEYKININIKIINNQNYQKEDYYNIYYDNINEALYLNTIILNYSTKEEIFDFFKDFNKNYNETLIKCNSYPFFLIDEKIYNKKELIKDIKKINENKPTQYHFQSRDILTYSDENSFKKIIIQICNYYTENLLIKSEEEEDEEKTLNILLCGIKGVGKTFFMNKLLFENRGLSKENNHTTKLNHFHHRLYPITFYDIPGFGENEDNEMTKTKSFINEFNSQYEKIKKKIHIILYIFNCDSSRVLQDKEIELIENFLNYHIPIYFIGNKCNSNDEKTFKRSILFNLKNIKSNYTKDYFESHIFCINDSNKSIYLLLSKISKDLEESTKAHSNIIKVLDNDIIKDCINKSLSHDEENEDNFNSNYEHQKKILKEMKNSIFINDLSYSINKIQEKVLEITKKIKNESKLNIRHFCSLKEPINNLTNQIKIEYQKLINRKDIEEIESIIQNFSQKNDSNVGNIVFYSASATSLLPIGLFIFQVINPLFALTSLIGLIPSIIFKIIYNDKEIDKFSKTINKRFIKLILLYNIISTKINAEKYNKIIEIFNSEYIKHFQTENENDIDLI